MWLAPLSSSLLLSPPLLSLSRYRRSEGAVAEAADGRRDSFRVRHDRASSGVERRDQHRDPDPARRRRVRHQRTQALDLRRAGPAMPPLHRDGHHEPRGAASRAPVDDPGRHAHAGRQDRPTPECLRVRRCTARPRRGVLHERARAGDQHPARRGTRLRDRPGTTRTGQNPSSVGRDVREINPNDTHARAHTMEEGVEDTECGRPNCSRTFVVCLFFFLPFSSHFPSLQTACV